MLAGGYGVAEYPARAIECGYTPHTAMSSYRVWKKKVCRPPIHFFTHSLLLNIFTKRT